LWLGGSLLFSVLLLVLLPDKLVLTWVGPVTDVASIVCYAVVARLGAIDARLRSDSAALPAAVIGAALSVTWLADLLLFLALPWLPRLEVVKDTSAWLCLAAPVATPFLLALAALHVPRPLADGRRWARAALGLGLAVGLSLVGIAVLLGAAPLQRDALGLSGHLAGVIGLVPLAVAGFALFRGHRCDDRVLRGVVPALALSGVNLLLLLRMTAQYTPPCYAFEALSMGIAIALLFGQFNLSSRSVRTELRAIGRLEGSFRTAEALTSSLQPAVVIDQLLEQGMAALEADRALLCRVEDDTIVVEGARALDAPAPDRGEAHPLSSSPAIEAAARQQRAQLATGPIAPTWLSGIRARRVRPAKQNLAVPLMCANDLVGVLVLARVRDVPFGPDDLAAVGTIAAVAALALRNSRQFAGVEEVSRTRSLFLNMAAHELRTPLSVVRGYASMLCDGTLGELPGECMSAAVTLQSKSDELAHQIGSLLTASRWEAGQAQPRWEKVDLGVAVGEALDRLRPSAELREARIGSVLPPGPWFLYGDPDYVSRILDNLLVNAIKYSPGRPSLRVSLASMTGGMAQVAVEDRGVGLRLEDHERIFERFERVEHKELGFPAGTGLGLYLSRRLAEAMGGSLRLERSSPGDGSRFVLELPLVSEAPSPKAAAAAAPGWRPPPGRPSRRQPRSRQLPLG